MANSHRIYNFNVGLMGHVDCGKTSLCKALSSIASTAAFDKNPQSKERGITLDMGFSSFSLDPPLPESISKEGYSEVRVTLVDSPGHASLLRTVLGAASIIDLIILVVDCSSGIQTQTAECIIVSEIVCPHIIVVLNKVDLAIDSRQIEKLVKRIRRVVPVNDREIVSTCALEGKFLGIDSLKKAIHNSIRVRTLSNKRGMLLAADHCFAIKGQGTIITGTVLRGALSCGDDVEIPSLGIRRRIKSMQAFRKPISNAMAGDRIGLCLTQFDPENLERGWVCSPSLLLPIHAAIIKVTPIVHYKQQIPSRCKFHIVIAHEVILASVSFFTGVQSQFNLDAKYLHQDELRITSQNKDSSWFALLEFERALLCPDDAVLIGCKLDADIKANNCRIAFHGAIVHTFAEKNYRDHSLTRLKVYKNKEKRGIIERANDSNTLICKGMFKKETDITKFTNMKVKLSTGEKGYIQGSFASQGKFKVYVPSGITNTTKELIISKDNNHVEVILPFIKYNFDRNKKMYQEE